MSCAVDVIVPEVGVSKPASMRSSVVLPEPEPPSRQNSSPVIDVERDVVRRRRSRRTSW